MSLKPVCVPCERFMRPKKIGYYFLEGMPSFGFTERGVGKGAIGWEPYKLWAGDLWYCPTCLTEIIVGTGMNPISEHYMEDFAETVERFNASQLLVKDC